MIDDVGVDGGVELHSFPVQTNEIKTDHQLESKDSKVDVSFYRPTSHDP